MTNPFDEREAEFSDAFQAEEVFDVERLILAWGRLGERIVLDDVAVDNAMRALMSSVGGEEVEDKTVPWMEVLARSTVDVADFKLSQILTSLHAYAFYGLDPTLAGSIGGEGGASIEAVERVVRKAREVLDAVPEVWERPEGMETTILAAEGRLALDMGAALSIEQFSALARLGLRTAKNLLMPSSAHRLRTDEEGRIPATEALGWLEKRDDFRTSIWREHRPAPRADSAQTDLTEEILFVPVAKDGSCFDPVTCCRAGSYTVGAKGDERSFRDYRAAMDALKVMNVPRWRRPNDKGNWGIVRSDGERWLRRTARELGLQAPVDQRTEHGDHPRGSQGDEA